MATSKKTTVVAKKTKTNITTKNVVAKKNKNLDSDIWNNNSSSKEKSTCCNNKSVLIIIILIVIIWLLWFIFKDKFNLNNPNQNWTLINNTTDTTKKIIKSWDIISVDYVWRLEDWSIFDTSIESFAKQSSNYDKNRPYKPLEFTVWQWQMISWFDKWVIWMSIWEKKTIKILAKDAYWDKTINQDMPIEYFQDTITKTLPIANFQDTITQTIPKNLLWDKLNNMKEWDSIEIESWLNWKILKIENESVTIAIKNTINPFYGKKLEKWLQTVYEWNLIVIKDIRDWNVTLEAENKQNPFYGKKLTEWDIWNLPNWEKIKILSLTWWSASIEINNPHPLAWKNLIFDIEIKWIK